MLGYVEGVDYAVDKHGQCVFAGDYVRLADRRHSYPYLRVGDNRRIQRVAFKEGKPHVMVNTNAKRKFTDTRYEMSFGWINPVYWERSACHHPAHRGVAAHHVKPQPQEEEYEMSKPLSLYTAILVFDGEMYSDTAERINEKSATIIADTSYESLKRKVEERIRANPTEQWVISGATVLAQISAPPVTYRQL
ncbi:hypothetical protein PQB35_gp20 [Ochrobactrum phage vB_OspP_OH]|uniref:Uncharacterized protein n=1 Tax=Ochrobactrum phage vB_OspP_OH TaxID=2712957 RepID=A0A6G6XXI4_9CAUD|nr:hypothetical protein PQB35_gp20 [Ochrobactrum phage vB_OspP_OH]QIG66076.1 hypothetical protein phiOH_p20 [Ochrobactrum phage vB_OspP_OH]